MELILIRHTSVDVPKGVCYGQTDVALRETFEQEAILVRDLLNKKLGNLHNPAVFSSPLSRCCKLAAFCGYEQPIFDPRIMEMNFGDWEMHAFDNISDSQLSKWFNNWIEETPTNGESFQTMIGRVEEFIQEQLASGHKQVLLFTHGGVIACARIYAGMTTADKAFESPAAYGEMITLSF